MKTSAESPHVQELRADARYHRERRDLYRAKSYGPRETSPARLRELELACETAESRLAAALRADAAGAALA